MALIALSTILSIILGSFVWLILGSQFPLNQDDKWPIANNISVYAVILLIPVYITIFFVF
jgi:NhaP-type Na+/H+ or K+/H+ antiporter